MILKLIRWIRGYVKFEVKGRFPERFMNLCLRQGVFLFETGPHNNKFMGSMLLSDYKNIRNFAKKAGVTLKVRERFGLPFLIKRYKGRSGLAVGFAVFILLSLIMQNFVWTVDINGINSLSEAHIRCVLKECGLYPGAFKGKLNYHAIERKIMREVEEIGWMSINVTGTKVETEIEEKAPVPFIIPAHEPCNLKAETDGIIISMNIKNGSTKLTKGSAVAKGQLIVSGVMQNALQESTFVHADADVIAATEHSMTRTVNKKGIYNKPVGVKERKSLDFLWIDVPFTFASAKAPFTSRVIKERLFLNSATVPLGVSTEICTLYEESSYELTDEKAKELLLTKDYLYRLFNLKDCIEIKASVSFAQKEDNVKSYIKYSCIEDIAYEEMIVVN